METFEGVDAGTDMTPPIKAKQQMKATKAAKRRDEADIERLMESSYEWKTSSRGRASPALYERDGATDALVSRHAGTVEKFIGAAAMAVFGVPRLTRTTAKARAVSRLGEAAEAEPLA